MSQCKNFLGKKTKISVLDKVAEDLDPQRSTEIYKMVLDVSKDWGDSYKPGQFIMLRPEDTGERIPLTVTNYSPSEGLTLVFQVLGHTTQKLANMKAGDVIEDLTYPLGTPLHVQSPKGKKDKVIVVSGGVGIAPAYAKAKAFYNEGYEIINIIGTRTKDLLFMLDEMRQSSNSLIITTDDGSYFGPYAAFKGDGSNGAEDRKLFGVQVLEEMINYKGKKLDSKMPKFSNLYKASEIAEIFVVGPPIMMKFVAQATRKMNIPTYASLNSIMIDGSGMCGGCKVTLKGDEKDDIVYTCKDGPTFDAHRVDWDEALQRGGQFMKQEQLSIALSKSKKPVEKITVKNSQKLSESDYLPKLAKYLGLPKTATVQQLMEGMQKKFSHKAGYISLEDAVNTKAAYCACKRKEDKKSKCQEECPVDIDINGFISKIKSKTIEGILGEGHDLKKILKTAEKKPQKLDPKILEVIDKQIYDAYKIITDSNPIPEITGLVCPQENQCQSTCIRGKKGDPVNIGKLEAFIAYWVRENRERIKGYDWFEKPKVTKPTGKKVMVVGSGPSGLIAANQLAKKGHDVTVYEIFHEPGGVLIYGIPEFRLPKDIVKYEISQIADLGVKFEFNHPIRDVEEHMKKHGFDAAFVGTGAGTPYFLGIHGESLSGVYSANEFLTRINLMKSYKFPVYDTPVPDVLDKNVVVFGGGNVAMDSARSALRLGAKKVTIMYRRTAEEIPARHEEFIEAQEEGIHFAYLTTPFELNGKTHIESVSYYDNELGEPDESGRRRPIPMKDKPQTLEADVAVIAIGQGPNQMMDTSAFNKDRKGRIIVEEDLETSIPGVYAGGDIISGNQGTVIYAAGCGLKAAKAIDKYLKK